MTVTVSGDPVEPLIVQSALRRLGDQRPFLHSMRYDSTRAEVMFWDEAESMLDAASLALRVWNEHRASAGLPRWEVVGLEVVERSVMTGRSPAPANVLDVHEVTPLPF